MEVFVTTVQIPQIGILFIFCPRPPPPSIFVQVDAHGNNKLPKMDVRHVSLRHVCLKSELTYLLLLIDKRACSLGPWIQSVSSSVYFAQNTMNT